ncbi:hypothetical protein [Streptomyces coelicoflavus]|uniref:hypothetical protein n=1 Tax=Streptomyces coelicoflavus TaxID=285562 RepID=UPI00368923A8
MATSHSVRPTVDRRVLLLLLDDQHRLMLCGGCCGGWTVPQALLGATTDFRIGAAQYLAERFRIEVPMFGTVYGVHETSESDCWEHDRKTVSRAFIVKISSEESDSLQLIAPSHTRWGIDQIKARHQEIHPEGMTLLVSGYVEGWLPDGPVSFR